MQNRTAGDGARNVAPWARNRQRPTDTRYLFFAFRSKERQYKTGLPATALGRYSAPHSSSAPEIEVATPSFDEIGRLLPRTRGSR